MQSIPIKRLGGLVLAAAISFALVGCKGDTGPAGTNGTNGTNGTDGTNGTNATITVNAAALTPDQWAQLSLKGQVTSVTMGGKPVVNFTVTDGNGTPVQGLGFSSQTSTSLAPALSNMAFTIAKLVPGTNGSPSKWVNYIVTTMPTSTTASAPTRPTTDNTGTLVDHGDGTYTYTFYRDITQAQAFLDAAAYTGSNVRADLGDVSYVPTLTHRIVVQVGGRSPADSTKSVKTPANIIYDFIPSTGAPVAATDAQRQVTSIGTCNTCHSKLAFHGGNRIDTQYCVMCHNDQRKFGRAAATVDSTTGDFTSTTYKFADGTAAGDMPVMIHKIHMGEELTKLNYNYANVLFNEITYPQDQRNCTKCHTATNPATPQGDAWMNNPSRLACGACHDRVDWANGTNHAGGPQLDDKNCTGCHGATGIQLAHEPLVLPDTTGYVPGSHTNGSYIAAYPDQLPAGAHRVTWDLKSFAIDSSSHPVFVFRFLEDGVRKDFNTYAAGATGFWDNYVGSPSFYVAMGNTQDGITAPADWNTTASVNLFRVWNGSVTTATLSAPDANGYYTLTMTAAIPAGATMVTGGIGYTYGYGPTAMPLTQTNIPGYAYDPVTYIGGLAVPAPNVWKLATGWTGNTARRAIVSNQKCNDCHAVLGIFTAKVYHAGERNDAPTCTFCHNVNRVNSGWGVNIKDAVHAIHAADKRDNKYSWEASAGDKYWNITNPAILNNCEACHVPGSYDFSASANAAAIPNLLWTTVATGTVSATAYSIQTGNETVLSTDKVISPFIDPNNPNHVANALPLGDPTGYGSGYGYNLTTATATQAAGTTLVNSPITSACSSCHDSKIAIAHMQGNGGAFYEPRSSALAKVEQCLICHGAGKTADIKAMHMNF